MAGKQEADANPEGPRIIDLSDGGSMSAMPDYVLKHMPKKWHSKMCQCCWHKVSEVALCMDCVDDLMGAVDESMSADGDETEGYSDPGSPPPLERALRGDYDVPHVEE